MARFLTDSEMLAWNKRLGGTYFINPRYGKKSSFPQITIKQVIKSRNTYSDEFVDTTDPHVEFNFIFSISKNRVDDFFRIFEKLLNEPLLTEFSYGEKDYKITFGVDLIKTKEETSHVMSNKEFVRYSYLLKGSLSAIICFVTTLEDTIRFVETMWGYTESGEEITLLKFPIGSLVSPVKNKSEDWCIIDLEFVRDYNFEIRFVATQMVYTPSSPVIKYGEVKKFRESELTFSRNSRIDEILN
jgi:hypothetical protein